MGQARNIGSQRVENFSRFAADRRKRTAAAVACRSCRLRLSETRQCLFITRGCTPWGSAEELCPWRRQTRNECSRCLQNDNTAKNNQASSVTVQRPRVKCRLRIIGQNSGGDEDKTLNWTLFHPIYNPQMKCPHFSDSFMWPPHAYGDVSASWGPRDMASVVFNNLPNDFRQPHVIQRVLDGCWRDYIWPVGRSAVWITSIFTVS